MVMNKRNEYTLYTSQENPPKPVKYEMMGYDTLLTSYYDHYVLDYTKFEPWDFDFSMFEIPSGKNLHCVFNLTFLRKKWIDSFLEQLQ